MHPRTPIIERIPIEWLGDQSSGTLSKEVNGRSLQLIYFTSSFTNWTTVGVFPTHESAAAVRQIQFYVVSFVFLICMMGITASLHVSHSISRPIQQLQSFMQKAEEGDLTVRHTSRRQDELGKLGMSFNKMLVPAAQAAGADGTAGEAEAGSGTEELAGPYQAAFSVQYLGYDPLAGEKKGANDVAEVVESLSRLFRIGLSKGQEMIPLLDEIEHIRQLSEDPEDEVSRQVELYDQAAPEPHTLRC